jgi:acetoin utilization deacetylase AcuC-like enzyme
LRSLRRPFAGLKGVGLRVPVVYHPAYSAPLSPAHRFPMPKFARLFTYLRETDLILAEQVAQPEPAPRAWLELAHEPAYVSSVLEMRLSAEAERRLGLPLSAPLVLRSRCAVAGTVLAARLALEHGIACNTAGGSHHAHAGFGAGFCVFNDVAVAARVLQAEGSIRQALVVDLDVHQGDGTAAICADDPATFTLSLHCRTNFPARKAQSDLDVALDPDLEDEPYLDALATVLPPLLARLHPDLVLYNAGVDPHHSDRLGRLALSTEGLRRRDRYVLTLCRKTGIPIACVVGGGYSSDIEELVRRHAILHEVIVGMEDD